MTAIWHTALSLGLAMLLSGCGSSYRYPGPIGPIPQLENFIRHNPGDGRVADARRLIVEKAARGAPWDEINEQFAQFEDIEGARYDEENDRLVIWGPKVADKTRPATAMPPMLFDDFVTALTVLEAGENPGVSIGTVRGRVPTEADIRHALATERLPIEYIPPSTSGTHLGSVLFEVDRCLKALAHGEDNLTRRPVSASVPGYLPVSRLLQQDTMRDADKPRPLGLWWFVPDETGVAIDGYTMRFVRYRMRVEYRALTDDPAVGAFGKHLSERFEDYAREFGLFRELVRIHKLVQVARWYQESGFPTESFRQSYRRLGIDTPETTRLIRTLVDSRTTPGPTPDSYYIHQSFLIGGVNLSPRNCYIPAAVLPPRDLTASAVANWQPQEMRTVQSVAAPPRYGSFRVGSVPMPAFAAPVLKARPEPKSYGWTLNLGGRDYAVVSIPARIARLP